MCCGGLTTRCGGLYGGSRRERKRDDENTLSRAGRGGVDSPKYPELVPRPRNERQALEEELAEIRGQIAAYWEELESRSPRRSRREQLEWQIREREKRLADVRARLAAIKAERG